jgi:hypothetical protein
MTMADGRERLKEGLGRPDLNQHDHRGHYGDGRCRVHDDAQRAMVGIAFERMGVCNLGHGKQRQQDQTHHCDQRQSVRLCTSIVPQMCLKSRQ